MLYVKFEMSDDPALGDVAGETTDWEEVPPEGLPAIGYPADQLVYVDATLSSFESMGTFSVAFQSDLYTIHFTHDPSKVP